MVCLGFEPGDARWWAQTKPRSYCDPILTTVFMFTSFNREGAFSDDVVSLSTANKSTVNF